MRGECADLEARTGIKLLYSAAIVKSKRFMVLIEAGVDVNTRTGCRGVISSPKPVVRVAGKNGSDRCG